MAARAPPPGARGGQFPPRSGRTTCRPKTCANIRAIGPGGRELARAAAPLFESFWRVFFSLLFFCESANIIKNHSFWLLWHLFLTPFTTITLWLSLYMIKEYFWCNTSRLTLAVSVMTHHVDHIRTRVPSISKSYLLVSLYCVNG